LKTEVIDLHKTLTGCWSSRIGSLHAFRCCTLRK